MDTKVILLDTDTVIEYMRNNTELIQYLDSIKEKYLFINSIIKAETQAQAIDKRDLSKANSFLENIPILNIDIETSELFLHIFELYTLSHKCKVPDMIIAAQCIKHDLHLLTLNTKDFKYIKGLKLIKHDIKPMPRNKGSWFGI